MPADAVKPDGAPALSLADARRRIHDAIRPVDDIERVPLMQALDRVLAEDLVASVAVPAHDNAAMDGYALSTDRARPPATDLRVVGEARAGRPYTGPLVDDACVRIMTGAMMPAGCDAVVPQEQVVVDGDRVRCDAVVLPGQHVRLAGEDLAIGSCALPRGRRLVPSDLGIAASLGAATLAVRRRPRVAVFSTGDELRDVGDTLEPGTIRDANRYTLLAMLARLGVETIDLGIVPDEPAALEAVLVRACANLRADAIVTSGGVSVGDADHTRAVMDRRGSIDFWTLAVKPGRPMAFGRVSSGDRDALLFGLPGNPVAVMVVFYALVRDAVLALSGASIETMPSIAARCEEAIAKVPGRTEFVRGVLSRVDDGWRVRPTSAQGSGVLRSMSEANGLIVLAHDRGPVAASDAVDVWPFLGLT